MQISGNKWEGTVCDVVGVGILGRLKCSDAGSDVFEFCNSTISAVADRGGLVISTLVDGGVRRLSWWCLSFEGMLFLARMFTRLGKIMG